MQLGWRGGWLSWCARLPQVPDELVGGDSLRGDDLSRSVHLLLAHLHLLLLPWPLFLRAWLLFRPQPLADGNISIQLLFVQAEKQN